MNLKDFIKSLQSELEENPSYGNLEVKFATGFSSDLLIYLSIYDVKSKYQNDGKKFVCIDVGLAGE
jgi:hypothetical protein